MKVSCGYVTKKNQFTRTQRAHSERAAARSARRASLTPASTGFLTSKKRPQLVVATSFDVHNDCFAGLLYEDFLSNIERNSVVCTWNIFWNRIQVVQQIQSVWAECRCSDLSDTVETLDNIFCHDLSVSFFCIKQNLMPAPRPCASLEVQRHPPRGHSMDVLSIKILKNGENLWQMINPSIDQKCFNNST